MYPESIAHHMKGGWLNYCFDAFVFICHLQ
jgi:hypothetical protein